MLRFFVLTGIIGGLVVAYLTTFGVGKITQLPPPESLLTEFRAQGAVPENVNLALDETAEELDVFTHPDADKAELAKARAAYDEMMSGMDMPGMDMSGNSGMNMNADNGGSMNMVEADSGAMNSGEAGAGMNMNADNGGSMNMVEADSGAMNSGGAGAGMNMNADNGGSMNMAEADSGAMNSGGAGAGMNMNADNGGSMNMAEADSGAMNSGGAGAGMNMNADNGGTMNMADNSQMLMGKAGLAFAEDGAFDREITLTMQEWKFSQMKIDVKPGERIKFTVKNGGQIPHEFMFMSPPLMNAVTYRATRADWNLFEHEALYERALVLPGGEFTFVMQVQKPGSWMFMCMLPYHMQMGMMGQMATEGMAMDM